MACRKRDKAEIGMQGLLMTVIIPTYPGASYVLYAKIIVTIGLLVGLVYVIKKIRSVPKT